ncbi:MAG: hypothetical protein GWP14_05265, partial [Actinobacteria bacterium]|nr:hypothetical protein [Actinomycetota bacterium]
MKVPRTTWSVVYCLVILLNSTSLLSAQDTDDNIEFTPQQKRRLLELVDEQAEPQPNDFRVYWKDGIRMESADKKFKLKFGGRLMGD